MPGLDDRWAGVPPRLAGLVLIGVAGQSDCSGRTPAIAAPCMR